MMRLALLLFVVALPAYSAVDCSVIDTSKHEIARDIQDVKCLATAPLRWDRKTWTRFAEGTAVVVALYATDRQTSDSAQQNRSSSTDQFAKTVTPFGGHRA